MKAKQITKAIGLGVVITACMVGIILGLQSVGISKGWLILVLVSLFIGIKGSGDLKQKLLWWASGSLYGLVAGTAFSINPAIFIAMVLFMTICMMGRWLCFLCNDYALIILTIYTICRSFRLRNLLYRFRNVCCSRHCFGNRGFSNGKEGERRSS